MKAVSTWQRGFESRLSDGRGHEVTIDLPKDEDGGDLGTSGLELAALSLAGCITTIFALVAERRRLPFRAMRVELEAHRPPRSKTITHVDGTFFLATSADRSDAETALAITLRTCPVGVIFELAHIPVQVTLVVEPEAEPARIARASHEAGTAPAS